eukprot:scaffold9834_cov105-Isochrysis_galbana.AAC.2
MAHMVLRIPRRTAAFCALYLHLHAPDQYRGAARLAEPARSIHMEARSGLNSMCSARSGPESCQAWTAASFS